MPARLSGRRSRPGTRWATRRCSPGSSSAQTGARPRTAAASCAARGRRGQGHRGGRRRAPGCRHRWRRSAGGGSALARRRRVRSGGSRRGGLSLSTRPSPTPSRRRDEPAKQGRDRGRRCRPGRPDDELPSARCRSRAYLARPAADARRRLAGSLGRVPARLAELDGRLPGFAYDGSDPDGFMPRDEIAGRVARYAEASPRRLSSGHEAPAGDAQRPGIPPPHEPGTGQAERVVVAPAASTLRSPGAARGSRPA